MDWTGPFAEGLSVGVLLGLGLAVAFDAVLIPLSRRLGDKLALLRLRRRPHRGR